MPGYHQCSRATVWICYLTVLLLVCCAVASEERGVSSNGRTKRSTRKSPFTEPGVIIGIIVGVTGVLVVVGVTILLCRLFCCKQSSCCSCCQSGESYQESDFVIPGAEKVDGSREDNTVSRDQPTRPRKSDRSKKPTPQKPPEYDDLAQNNGGGWKVLDINKFIKESVETNSSEDLEKNTKGANDLKKNTKGSNALKKNTKGASSLKKNTKGLTPSVTSTDVDSPRPLKYDFDDLENSPVVSKRKRREPVVKSPPLPPAPPSPASTETSVEDFSGREEDRNPTYSKRGEDPRLEFSMSEFPSATGAFQNDRYGADYDRDRGYIPYEGGRGEQARALPTGEYSYQASNIPHIPRESNVDESDTAPGEYGYHSHILNQPSTGQSAGAVAPATGQNRQQQVHHRPQERPRPSPRVMTNPKESYNRWDIDPSYCDGKQRVWDGKHMVVVDTEDEEYHPQSTSSQVSHQNRGFDPSYTHSRQRPWEGHGARARDAAEDPLARSERGNPSAARHYGGAVNMAYNTDSTETTV